MRFTSCLRYKFYKMKKIYSDDPSRTYSINHTLQLMYINFVTYVVLSLIFEYESMNIIIMYGVILLILYMVARNMQRTIILLMFMIVLLITYNIKIPLYTLFGILIVQNIDNFLVFSRKSDKGIKTQEVLVTTENKLIYLLIKVYYFMKGDVSGMIFMDAWHVLYNLLCTKYRR